MSHEVILLSSICAVFFSNIKTLHNIYGVYIYIYLHCDLKIRLLVKYFVILYFSIIVVKECSLDLLMIFAIQAVSLKFNGSEVI